VSLTVRTWLRYVVPLSLLAVIALLPVAFVGWSVEGARDLATARAQIRTAWLVAGCAWVFQLWLVAGVAPAMRSLAAGEPLSQVAAFRAGCTALVHRFVPCLIAVIAIVLGTLALVVPGILLLAVLATTGASMRGTLPRAALTESIAAARTMLRAMVLLAIGVLVIDLAVALAAHVAFVPAIAKKASAAKLLPIRTFVRVVALALVAISPLVACALAASRFRARRAGA
jgi:hypothetical protein